VTSGLSHLRKIHAVTRLALLGSRGPLFPYWFDDCAGECWRIHSWESCAIVTARHDSNIQS
jgi:hypothetical protein